MFTNFKLVLFITALLLVVGFSKKPPQPLEIPPEADSDISKPIPPREIEHSLLWDGSKYWTKEWNDHLRSEIKKMDWSGIKVPCKIISKEECVAHVYTAIAKRESDFNPNTKYNESGHLAGVVSRGLFQISMDSANQSAYKCGIKKAEELHNPLINISCMNKITHYQAKKTGVLIDGEKGGCGAYHSVCRSKKGKSESYKFIMNSVKGK